MSFVIRNYGPSRQVPFKNQHICIGRDQAIVTDDVEEVNAFSGQEQISITKQPGTVAAPLSAPPVPPVVLGIDDYEAMKKRELLSLAEERGIELPSQITKKELIELLVAWDENQALPDNSEEEQEDEDNKDDEDYKTEESDLDIDYQAMRKAELVALVEERDLEVPTGATKAELIELLS